LLGLVVSDLETQLAWSAARASSINGSSRRASTARTRRPTVEGWQRLACAICLSEAPRPM